MPHIHRVAAVTWIGWIDQHSRRLGSFLGSKVLGIILVFEVILESALERLGAEVGVG